MQAPAIIADQVAVQRGQPGPGPPLPLHASTVRRVAACRAPAAADCSAVLQVPLRRGHGGRPARTPRGRARPVHRPAHGTRGPARHRPAQTSLPLRGGGGHLLPQPRPGQGNLPRLRGEQEAPADRHHGQLQQDHPPARGHIAGQYKL